MDFKKIWTWVLNFLHLLKNEAQEILVKVDKLVDAIKEFEGTPTGQAIEQIAKSFLPADLVSAFTLYLPTIFKKLNWVKTTVNKTDDQIIAEGWKYIQSITDGKIKTVQLGALNSLISNWVAENKGVDLTIQQAHVANQVVHNPDILKA